MNRYRILGLAMVVVFATAALSWAGVWLGVYTQEVDPDLAEAFALEVDRGAIINEIIEASPADEAGLREDDIIISFGGDRVRDDDDLIDLVMFQGIPADSEAHERDDQRVGAAGNSHSLGCLTIASYEVFELLVLRACDEILASQHRFDSRDHLLFQRRILRFQI